MFAISCEIDGGLIFDRSLGTAELKSLPGTYPGQGCELHFKTIPLGLLSCCVNTIILITKDFHSL